MIFLHRSPSLSLGRRLLLSSQRQHLARVSFSDLSETKVGIFIDSDNFSGDLIPERRTVADWVRPLRFFGEAAGTVNAFQAFANENTQRFKQNDDRKAILKDQEWWEPGSNGDDDDDDLFPGAMVQTGYDETGTLRCGVCGAKMKLTKKDRARGWDEHDKLGQHMKMLHDREQAKRKNYLKQNKKKKGKRQKLMRGDFGIKYRKYNAAQVGLGWSPKNDLFRILKEEGVRCRSCHDVDKELIKEAKRWIDKNSQSSKGVLVVASQDSDFVPLLEVAQHRPGWCAVTAAPKIYSQTEALLMASDISLLANEEGILVARPLSSKGIQFMDDLGMPKPAIFPADIDEEEEISDDEIEEGGVGLDGSDIPICKDQKGWATILTELCSTRGIDVTAKLEKKPWRMALVLHRTGRGQDASKVFPVPVTMDEIQIEFEKRWSGQHKKLTRNQRKKIRSYLVQERRKEEESMVLEALRDLGEDCERARLKDIGYLHQRLIACVVKDT